jgi:hypothetical protein
MSPTLEVAEKAGGEIEFLDVSDGSKWRDGR